MDLMLDPACEYETFMDALTVGRACDEAGFDWYEDPYRDTGSSAHGHRKLSQRLDTPILLTEYVRGLAPRADLAVADATDLLRSDPDDDGGITGAMRVAHLAAGLGLDVEYHAPGPAKRHCLAATRNARYYELGLLHPGWDNPLEPPVYADDYGDSLADVDADGTVPVPDGPGLGVDYDWDRIDRLTTTRRSFT
jgi:L-alanine-DL-glutamate epimerase-like enolase superfamily enzyme